MNTHVPTRSLLLFGDSILSNWYTQLRNELNGWKVTNKAVSGETTTNLINRLHADVIHQPEHIVVIHAGINDIAGNSGVYSATNTIDNLATIVRAAKQSHKHVLLSNLLPVSTIPWRECDKVYEHVLGLNLAIKALATDEALPLLDFFTSMANNNGLMDKQDARDGVHPNKHSYGKMLVPLINTLNAIALDP